MATLIYFGFKRLLKNKTKGSEHSELKIEMTTTDDTNKPNTNNDHEDQTSALHKAITTPAASPNNNAIANASPE
eukprot:Awhi_evm2s9876